MKPNKDTYLTHLDTHGQAHMVDVGQKPPTRREAVAKAFISMKMETLKLILKGSVKKGDVFAVARIAGIMGAKKTPELVPLCHPLPLNKVEVSLKPDEDKTGIEITATVQAETNTGVEMEALTAVVCAGLTIYDMCKSTDRAINIGAVRLVRKRGGSSGDICLE